jgi:ribonuclease Z
MPNLELIILGSNSAVPAHKRNPTAQILRNDNVSILIDCGEGTQFQLNRFHIKRAKLDYILISHMHGDHYFGLVGLLNSFRLNNRLRDLHIYAPPELEQIILLQANFKEEEWPFTVHFHAMSFGASYQLFETKDLIVKTIPLNHRVPCNGFLIKEQVKSRKIVSEAIVKYGVPHTAINSLKDGADYLNENKQRVANHLLTAEPLPSFSYAYCSDTTYYEALVPIIKDVDVLYHEATFMDEAKDKAALRFHSTTKEAATIAKMANVGQLIIGHYSAKYKDLNPLLEEAKSVFPNSALAIEGEHYPIG